MNPVRDSRSTRALLIWGSLFLPFACSDDTDHPPGAISTGGTGATGTGGSGASGPGNSGGGAARGGNGNGTAGEGATGNGSGGDSGTEGGASGTGADTGAGAAGPEEGGTGNGTGGSGNRGGSDNSGGSTNRGGSSSEGGSGGEVTACATDGIVDPPGGIAGVCDVNASFGAGMDVPIPNVGTQLISITPDELTMVWYAETSGPLTTYVADRTTASGTFGAAQDLPGRDILGLSPDGMRLVTLSGDQSELGVMARAARGDAFEAAGAGEFAQVNADAAAHDRYFSNVVISADDRALYYLLSSSDTDPHPLRVSRRTGAGPWPVGVPLEDCELEAHGADRRVPTGVSADGLTLFYYDEVSREQRAAYRSTANGPILWVQPLTMRDAQPNEACDRLYFSGVTGPLYADAQ